MSNHLASDDLANKLGFQEGLTNLEKMASSKLEDGQMA